MKIGIDLGGSHIAIGVIDQNNSIMEKMEKRLMAEDKKNIEITIENYIIRNIKQLLSKFEVTEVGIAAPGTVKDGIILKSANLGIENYNLVDNLRKEIDLPIKIRNDAKCAALAESRSGALKNYKRGVFLTLGTGIGGAVILDGNLLDTGELPGCEFGHMTIQKDGVKCNCGRSGCFEKYASMKSFKDNLRSALKLDETTSGEELVDIIKNNPNDIIINRIIEEFIEYLSIGISNLINIFEPEAVGIGGSFIYFSDILLDKLVKNIQDKKYLFNNRETLIIVPAELGNDAGIIGSCQ